jgi:hypothetical protein
MWRIAKIKSSSRPYRHGLLKNMEQINIVRIQINLVPTQTRIMHG